ncbi:MAG: hypothetical protein AAF418_06900, partial [Pseudomonadota bacterium]
SYPFTHGQNWSIEAADHWPGQRRLMLYSSYHCSRYNVNTKRLSAAMFDQVIADIRDFLDNQPFR